MGLTEILENKFLLYLDILGFAKRATDIASSKGIDVRDIRDKFIEVIKERVSEVEQEGWVVGKKYGESDDWLLVIESVDDVFRCIYKILEHRTGYEGYEEIPLEVAVGIGQYDKWARLDGKNLIVEDSTIEFIKTNIVGYYHKVYREEHDNESPTSSFVIITDSAYDKLEPFDRDFCRPIEYQANKKHVKFFIADVDGVKQRGRVFDFLERIDHPYSRFYYRIDELYVPPTEYDDVRRTLEEKKIVIIIGPQEYGKTYTAVRLMWEYYNKGFQPKWVKGGEEKERIQVRERLENIETELKPQHIIYFEDPFGKTEYDERESLERGIGNILDSVERAKNAYVVITSREEVFKEFGRRKLSEADLMKFEQRLGIKKPSYDDNRRIEVLIRWANEEDCEWLKRDSLKRSIVALMRNREVLPTPLSIRDFAKSTVDIKTEAGLLKKAKEKSVETEKVFAREIETMTDDKILFLCFMFISPYFEVEFVKEIYQKIVKDIGIKSPMDFETLLTWFKYDKIEISSGQIGFSHTSYSEALVYLLSKDGYSTRINAEIFSKLLLELSDKRAAGAVARVVESHFEELHEEIRNMLLLKLSSKEEAAGAVARVVESHFKELHEEIRNMLLLKLSDKEEAAGAVAGVVESHFEELHEEIRNMLLLKLSNKEKAVGIVVPIVAEHFSEVSEEVRLLLFKLSEEDETVQAVAWTIAVNFKKLPEEVRNTLLLTLSQKERTVFLISWVVASHFEELPEEVSSLLFKLSEREGTAETVARVVESHFNELPEQARNLLLIKLSEREKAAGVITRVVENHFNELPEEVRASLSIC